MVEEIDNRVMFTSEMKQTHTILLPMMLPIHFELLVELFRLDGYKVEIIDTRGSEVVDCGLKYVHNDMCYPAQLTIGQLINAVESGKYDTDKIALLLMQTGGGCRASNYLRLLRKGLDKANFSHIPVISLNYTGLEKNSGFNLSTKFMLKLIKAVVYGDLLMSLRNQLLPYEVDKGSVDKKVDEWVEILVDAFRNNKGFSKRDMQKYMQDICKSFKEIEIVHEDRVKVGVVGEIYIKFAPLGNNNLEEFLQSEGVEVVVPGLLDFLLYTIDDHYEDYKLYGASKMQGLIFKGLTKYFVNMQDIMINTLKENEYLTIPANFYHTKEVVKPIINFGVKMGEGWLLTAEMMELIDSGVENIVCTQPFGCLPNHICGRGMIRKIKDYYPKANIVAIDYDASATKVNQENRIKLMLATAKGVVKDSINE